jgi:hypothetical protein
MLLGARASLRGGLEGWCKVTKQIICIEAGLCAHCLPTPLPSSSTVCIRSARTRAQARRQRGRQRPYPSPPSQEALLAGAPCRQQRSSAPSSSGRLLCTWGRSAECLQQGPSRRCSSSLCRDSQLEVMHILLACRGISNAPPAPGPLFWQVSGWELTNNNAANARPRRTQRPFARGRPRAPSAAAA